MLYYLMVLCSCHSLTWRVIGRHEKSEEHMRISYRPLWIKLAERELSKQQLREMSGISTSTLAKLGKGENMTTDVLLKICEALNCNINEIIETVPDDKDSRTGDISAVHEV